MNMVLFVFCVGIRLIHCDTVRGSLTTNTHCVWANCFIFSYILSVVLPDMVQNDVPLLCLVLVSDHNRCVSHFQTILQTIVHRKLQILSSCSFYDDWTYGDCLENMQFKKSWMFAISLVPNEPSPSHTIDSVQLLFEAHFPVPMYIKFSNFNSNASFSSYCSSISDFFLASQGDTHVYANRSSPYANPHRLQLLIFRHR